jgi:branched-chain amino acid transport system ATP-binding protein
MMAGMAVRRDRDGPAARFSPEEEGCRNGSAEPRTALLEAKDVRVRYSNGAIGLSSVSLRVEAGQVVAVLGASGAGKTTCMRALSGFLRTEGARITAGWIRLDGADITGREPHQIARLGVAFVPERRKVFSRLNVAENLAAVRTTVSRASRAQELERVFTLFPILKERRKQIAGSLSGGEQQMLAIGRALLRAPRLLIIDELTLGLHHGLHAPLYDVMARIAAGGTAVVVVDDSTAHAIETAQYCYVLRVGRVDQEGPAAHFRNRDNLLASYTGAATNE